MGPPSLGVIPLHTWHLSIKIVPDLQNQFDCQHTNFKHGRLLCFPIPISAGYPCYSLKLFRYIRGSILG